MLRDDRAQAFALKALPFQDGLGHLLEGIRLSVARLKEDEVVLVWRLAPLRAEPDHADFEAVVGEGTYIRSLARDLAERLGTLGHIAELRRLSVGRFTENRAISLDMAVSLGHSLATSEHLLPIETALDDIPALALTATEAARLRHGQRVRPEDAGERTRLDHIQDGTIVGARHQQLLVALARIEAGELRPVRVINR